MKFEVETKISRPERLKIIGEKLTRSIISSDFKGDIEVIGLLQELLSSTGADLVRIQEEMKQDSSESTCPHFNDYPAHEKWSGWKEQKGVWRCPNCLSILEDGPKAACPFDGSSVRCGICMRELTHRTAGGQSDPFRWILDENA